MAHAPDRLATARLVLRRPTLLDAGAVLAFASDREVTRYMSWPAHAGIEDTVRYLEFADGMWARHGIGPLLIELQGAVVGSTGLESQPSGCASTGYILARPVWGRGFATESCRAMVALARSLGFPRIEAQCHAEHALSARVLEKCGFAFEGLRPAHALFPNLATEPQDVRLYAWSAP
jgi:ribosomal-protein-alanine N-acetyltransferase